MKYRDAIFATLTLAMTSLALAGVMYTDAYSQAARSEARGLHALTEQVRSGDTLVCADTALLSADAGTVNQ